MRVRNVRPWRQEDWTQLYEAALFERNTLRLWTRIWRAQLAILEREGALRHSASVDSAKERIALRKAESVLKDLRRLANLDHPLQRAN